MGKIVRYQIVRSISGVPRNANAYFHRIEVNTFKQFSRKHSRIRFRQSSPLRTPLTLTLRCVN